LFTENASKVVRVKLDTTVEEDELLKAVGREILNELNELER